MSVRFRYVHLLNPNMQHSPLSDDAITSLVRLMEQTYAIPRPGVLPITGGLDLRKKVARLLGEPERLHVPFCHHGGDDCPLEQKVRV